MVMEEDLLIAYGWRSMHLRHLRPVNGTRRSQPDLERSRRTPWGSQDLRKEEELNTSMGQHKEHLAGEEHFLWGRRACTKVLRPEQTRCVGRLRDQSSWMV